MDSERRVTVLSTEEILRRSFFQLKSIRFTHSRFDGTESEPVARIVFERGDSVGMLLHDQKQDQVILVEQLRVATLGHGDGWILEIPAGKVDDGETPDSSARREIQEETGAEAVDLHHISTFFLSPGASSERLHLFYAPFPDGLEIAEHAGLAAEDEDIRVHRVKREEAEHMLSTGKLIDAKTIIAIQWLATHPRSAPRCSGRPPSSKGLQPNTV